MVIAAPGGLRLSEKVEKGDLVYIDYEAWIVNPNGQEQLYETTKADLAKDHQIYNEKRAYGEMPVVVGKGRLMQGLEEALLETAVGKEDEVLIPPDKGAGERDPKLVELLPLREFHRQEIEPSVGMEVSIRNRRGTVTAVTGGRVRVDFNNPLAGRTLKYRYRVAKKAKDAKDQVRGILEMDYGLAGDFKIEVSKGQVEIELPDVCKTDDRWFVAKFRVVSDLREVAGIGTVRFIEEYKRKEDVEKERERAEEVVRPPSERAEEEIPPEEREELRAPEAKDERAAAKDGD